MGMLEQLVNAICPDMPSDRKVVPTMDRERYYYMNRKEKVLYVPSPKILKVNLVEIDKFAEALHCFEKVEDWDAAEYDWGIDTTKNYHTFEDIKNLLFTIKHKVSSGYYDKYISVDIETRNTGWDSNKFLCIGIAAMCQDGTIDSFALNWDSSWEDILTPFLTSTTLKRVLHNGKFDKGRLQYLENIKCQIDEDTMLMHYVGINEKKGTQGLKELAMLYLQAPEWEAPLDAFRKEYCRIHKIKLSEFTYDLFPRDMLMKYLHYDCVATLRLFYKFKTVMRPEAMDIYRHLIVADNVYCQVELNGVKIDIDYLNQLGEDLSDEIEQTKRTISLTAENIWDPYKYVQDSGARTLPKAFNIKSPKQLKWILERILGHPVESTDKDSLADIEEEIKNRSDIIGKDFIVAIMQLRKLSKQYDTYAVGIQNAMCKDLRVRGSYLLHGTETGRLSSKEPNMQNIPRDHRIKNLFVAAPGKIFIQMDYSQAELRVLAYLSGDPWLTDVYVRGDDLHDRVALQMFGEGFTKDQRVMAKTINFGIAYGRGAANIAEVFNLSVVEAQKLINDWFVPMPKVKEYLEGQKRKPFQDIPVTTVFGRQRSFIITGENNYSIRNEAMNMPIQSTASDCTLISLCTIQKWIEENHLEEQVKICITVHDSIVIECDNDKALVDRVAEKATKTMAEVPKIYLPNNNVPFRADAEIGYKWGEMEEWTPGVKEKE